MPRPLNLLDTAACLDLGSYSLGLLVARLGPAGPEALLEKVVITGLGQGLSEGGLLRPDAVERTVRAAAELVADAEGLGAHPFVVGTAALREARNPEVVAAALGHLAGCEVVVLSAEQEACLAAEGARSGLDGLERAAVTDVGGRSTDIAWTDASGPRSLSLPLGASRTAEALARSGADLAGALVWLQSHVRDTLEAADGPWVPPVTVDALVACGGSASVLGSLALGASIPEGLPRIHGLVIDRDIVSAWAGRLASTDLEGRVRLGVPRDRAAVAAAGAAILRGLVEIMPAGIPLRISVHGLRWGVVGRLLGGRGL